MTVWEAYRKGSTKRKRRQVKPWRYGERWRRWQLNVLTTVQGKGVIIFGHEIRNGSPTF
jgi:hypothetical protein